MVGQTIKVLIDETDSRKKTAIARHTGQAPDIDGRVYLKKCSAGPGEIISVVISDFNGYDLVGMPVEGARSDVVRAVKKASGFSLPVVGMVNSSVETKSKGR